MKITVTFDSMEELDRFCLDRAHDLQRSRLMKVPGRPEKAYRMFMEDGLPWPEIDKLLGYVGRKAQAAAGTYARRAGLLIPTEASREEE